jgi:peroxiredoxin
MLIAILFTSVACSNKGSQFTVEGKITDADSVTLYLEKRALDKVTLIDSVKLDSQGNFKFEGLITPYPEFYVLHIKGQVINFAIDSVENVKIEASGKDFATGYKIEGNIANQQIKEAALAQYKASRELNDLQQQFAKKTLNEEGYLTQIQTIANTYKETATKIIGADFKSPAAYFALFQKVNGYLFFDPYDKPDYKLFAAVATSWDSFYNNSPRSAHMRDYTLIAMKVRKQSEQTPDQLLDKANEVQSEEYYKIELPDVNAKTVTLASLRGKIVLVDFTVYQSPESPAHNIVLNRTYAKFKPNLEIYQVSFDSDIHAWKNAAVNLPWITVHENKSVSSDLIFKYNIQTFPSLYLIDRNGNIVKRLSPNDNVDNEIQKII